ncbi:MAG: hypothetical protein BMS9Abin36_1604 [Gammaproteobacteria bacterium]|nr:MAG: hypothetical protein BMS9Abin36_1604 [Gammaproteobacteria bacterium]
MKLLLLFLVLFMSIAVNLPDSYIARLGIEPDYIIAALAAIVVAGLVVHRKLLLIVLVVALSIGTNMPEPFMTSIGVGRDYLFATLIAIVIVPWIIEQFR